jgi:hypothetical protein
VGLEVAVDSPREVGVVSGFVREQPSIEEAPGERPGGPDLEGHLALERLGVGDDHVTAGVTLMTLDALGLLPVARSGHPRPPRALRSQRPDGHAGWRRHPHRRDRTDLHRTLRGTRDQDLLDHHRYVLVVYLLPLVSVLKGDRAGRIADVDGGFSLGRFLRPITVSAIVACPIGGASDGGRRAAQ